MKRIPLIVTLVVSLLSLWKAGAQPYHTGIGLRFGYTPGLTIKHFVSSTSAIEGIIGSRYRGMVLTGLYEVNFLQQHGLAAFAGVGGHVGFYRGYYVRVHHGHWDYVYYDGPNASVGIDGILGLEYTFHEVPLNFGFDVKPYFDILEPGIVFWDAAISARLVF
jgi:hypothetical protein